MHNFLQIFIYFVYVVLQFLPLLHLAQDMHQTMLISLIGCKLCSPLAKCSDFANPVSGGIFLGTTTSKRTFNVLLQGAREQATVLLTRAFAKSWRSLKEHCQGTASVTCIVIYQVNNNKKVVITHHFLVPWQWLYNKEKRGKRQCLHWHLPRFDEVK